MDNSTKVTTFTYLHCICRIQRHHVVNPLIQNKNTSGVQLDVLSNGDQKYNCDQKSTTSESDCGGSLGTTDLLLSSESRLDSRCLSETQNSNLSSELMLQPRPDNILSACTSEITNNSEYMHGQAPCLNRQSTGDHETSIGASVNCTEGSDSHPQAAYSGSQYPNRRLQQVGQENTRPIQCTSPRNSYHGSSIHAGARPSVDGNADSLVNNDDIDNRPSLHSSPIEATPDGRGSGRSYMAVPQHLFVSSANPHPDDVHRTHQRREGRANEEDFGTLVGYALANGEPNNDTARVE